MSKEPCFDVAHLGHLELLTNKLQESLDFFVNVYGLTESGREGDSIYLRGWDDYEFHTLKLTASNATGMPLVTNQPLAGEIGLITVVTGGASSILRVMLLAVVSSLLPATSVLQKSIVCVPFWLNEKAPA